jgi:hypothetical protein
MDPKHPSDINEQLAEEKVDAVYVYSFIYVYKYIVNLSLLLPYIMSSYYENKYEICIVPVEGKK